MNRLDKVVVFHPLREEQLEQILEIELGMVQQRVLDTARGQFLFRVTPAGEEIPAAGRNGPEVRGAPPEARHREVTSSIRWPTCWRPSRSASATCWSSIGTGSPQHLTFQKEGEGAVLPVSARTAPRRQRSSGHGDRRKSGRSSRSGHRARSEGSGGAAVGRASPWLPAGAKSTRNRRIADNISKAACFAGRPLCIYDWYGCHGT